MQLIAAFFAVLLVAVLVKEVALVESGPPTSFLKVKLRSLFRSSCAQQQRGSDEPPDDDDAAAAVARLARLARGVPSDAALRVARLAAPFDDVRLALPLDADPFGAGRLLATGRLHWRRARVLGEQLEAVRGRCFVVDVGAGTGLYTALAAAHYGCRVHAFEPQRRFLPYVSLSALVNGVGRRVVVDARAVHASSLPARAASRLYVQRPRELWSLAATVAGEEMDEQKFIDASVPLQRAASAYVALDDAFAAKDDDERAAADIDLLVVDSNGQELEVLQGAARLLAACRVRALLVALRRTGHIFAKVSVLQELQRAPCAYAAHAFNDSFGGDDDAADGAFERRPWEAAGVWPDADTLLLVRRERPMHAFAGDTDRDISF